LYRLVAEQIGERHEQMGERQEQMGERQEQMGERQEQIGKRLRRWARVRQDGLEADRMD
jgi:hypothetical protein